MCLKSLHTITDKVRGLVHAGSNGSFRRTHGNAKVVQFNMCKLLIVLCYVVTGNTGKHARRKKSPSDPSATSPDTDESGDEVDDTGPAAKKRCAGPSAAVSE